MQGGEDTLRRSIAATTDGRARARLRVELAGVVRARDPAAAREEVVQAFREVGPTPALTMAALSLARALEPVERVAWLQKLAAPAIGVALAQAQLEANQPRGAALTLLSLARDARAPLHHRRAAARKAIRLAGRVDAAIARAAFHTSAMLVTGKTRRLHLGRALALPAAATDANDLEQLVATALDWLKDGGGTSLCEEALARIRAKGYASPAVDRLAAALAGQLPRKLPPKAEPPPRRPPQARPRTRPGSGESVRSRADRSARGWEQSSAPPG